jgi:ABC-type Mn2+/Zn2+ transport system permease subunit
MIWRRSSLFTAAGSLVLAFGIAVRLWTSGSFSHFASGFLLGVSIALLILGLARPSRSISR